MILSPFTSKTYDHYLPRYTKSSIIFSLSSKREFETRSLMSLLESFEYLIPLKIHAP